MGVGRSCMNSFFCASGSEDNIHILDMHFHACNAELNYIFIL